MRRLALVGPLVAAVLAILPMLAKPQAIQSAANVTAWIHAADRLESQGYISAETRAALVSLAGRPTATNAEYQRMAKEVGSAFDALYPARGASAQITVDAGLLRNIPRPDRVIADAGSDTAHKVAALLIVRDAIRWASGMPLINMFPQEPKAQAMVLAYMSFEFEIEGNAVRAFNRDGCTGYNCPRKKYFDSKSDLELSDSYRREVLGRYFTTAAVSGFIDARNGKVPPPWATQKQTQQPTNTFWSDVWDMVTGIFGILLLLFILFLIFRPKPQAVPQPPPVSDNYGRASFAPPLGGFPQAATFRNGIFLGKMMTPNIQGQPDLTHPYTPVFTEPEHHTLIVARTGTGKGTRVIVPTLLRFDGSILAIDPKGENAAITARTRRDQMGQKVHVLNPWGELATNFASRGFTSTAIYNPLDILDRHDPNAVAVAQTIAATICPRDPDGKNAYWQGAAANIITAVLLWIADTPGESKTLARARQLLSQSRKDLTDKCLLSMQSSEAYGGAISEMISHLLDMADVTYSGVISNVNEAMKFLSDPQVKAATDTSTFSMEDLIFSNTTVFLVIPPDRMQTQQAWLRLVLNAAMQTFKKHRFDERRGKRRCMFLIDEFPALGTIEEIPIALATMRGYGLDFTLVIQGLDQLKAHYGKTAETILNNCAYKWFCNVSDLETAKYVSDSLGQKTVRTISKTSGASQGPSGEGATQSESHGETGRPLMRHEEILTLGRNYAICLAPLKLPLFLQPIDYWNLEEAFSHLRADFPQLYWQPPLEYDANPYSSKSSEQRGQKNNQQREHKQEQRAGSEKPNKKTGMTKTQAREVLGVGPDATPDEIKAAYKRLIGKLHPDKGGSNFLSQQINAAKDTLLDEE